MSGEQGLPPGWASARLSDLTPADAPIVYGIIQPGPHIEDGVPFIRPVDIVRPGRVVESELPRTSTEIADRYARSSLAKGDLVYSIVGTIGKWFIVPARLSGANITQSSVRIRPYSSIDARYLLYSLQTPPVIQQMAKAMFGNAVQRLNVSHVRDLEIPVAPENEQRRIVGRVDDLQDRSRRVRKALDAIGQREVELVQRYTSDWPESRLGDFLVDATREVGAHWADYPAKGLTNDGVITERKEPIGEKSAPKCKVVQPGDIVFNPIRFSIGSIARYLGTEEVIVSPEYRVVRTTSGLSSELLTRFLRTPMGRSLLTNQTRGSVRFRVYFKHLREVRMPIAPPEVQREAEAFFTALNALKGKMEQISTSLDTLDQAILAKAFSGELVPQDPNDEPAEVLLKRIRAERAAASKPKRRSR